MAKETGLQALKESAESVLTESQKEVPLDTGTLMRSGLVETQVEGEKVISIVSYNTPYARWWHENDTHPRFGTPVHFKNGRKMKYLEDPFKRLLPRIDKFIRLRVKVALKEKR